MVTTIVAALAALLAAAPGQQCSDEVHRTLDFWIGEWDVRVGDETVGRNRIEKVLGGCAITETWSAARGGEGRSLFYYVPAAREWRQVWVTENPAAPGGVKEKRGVEGPAGAVRFQGEITTTDGSRYLDRTTLTPLADDRVRQHIEISTDRGATWRTTFDAVYMRRPGS